MVRFTHWAFYPHGKSPWYTFDTHWTRVWLGTHIRSALSEGRVFHLQLSFSLKRCFMTLKDSRREFWVWQGRGFVLALWSVCVFMERNNHKLRVVCEVRNRRTRGGGGSFKFKVCKSVHHHTVHINQPTRCNNFSSLLLDVYVQLNMFRASSRPSSGAQQLQ
jgi:hypothetical protein